MKIGGDYRKEMDTLLEIMQKDGCFVEIYLTVGGVKAAVNKDLIDEIIKYARLGYGEAQ
jgi:hypothetical protein